MNKGDIVLVPFPFTDLSGNKVRPALVLHASKKSEDFVCAFISSVSHKNNEEFEVMILPSKENGLKVPSCLRINKIATLQKSVAIGEIGTLEASIIKAVDKELHELFKI